MKLFLSWSGERSLDFAKAIREWIELVLGKKVDFLLSDDIDPGKRWNNTLAQGLDEADLGLLCLTSESLSSQWIGFEAGWLARRLKEGSMIPLLLDVAPEALSGPLSQFQSRRVDEKGMQDIIQVINQRLDSPENEGLVRTRVRVLFPELLRKLEPIILWGRLGVMAEYIRIGDQPTLASLYGSATGLVRRATKSIEVLTSGFCDRRQSDAKDMDEHATYTDSLIRHISERRDLSYREIIQFDIWQQPFLSNKAWSKHVGRIVSLAKERSNVNLRSMPTTRSGSFLIVDGRYLLLELAEEYGQNNRHVMGGLSLQDSDGIVPQAVLRDFETYWDRGSVDVYSAPDSQPSPAGDAQ